MHIKKAVYEKMDELTKEEQMWSLDFVSDFDEWKSAWAQDFIDGENKVIDFDWNIIKK